MANDWQPRLKQLDMFAKHSGCIKSCDTDRRNDWQEVSLASACIKVTDGSHFSPTPRSHGRPIANVKDLRPGFVDFLSCTKIAEEDFQELVRNGCDIQRHDVLLSKDGTIGRVVVYEQDEPLVALSSIAILRPGKALDPFFLGQALQSSHVTKQIGIFAGGSALHRLVLRDIHRIFIPLPSLAEQRRIAAVLDTVDETIAKTEAVITRLKQVRIGLLHDLLTRGFDEHGQLRDPIAHPEQFQDSSLGRIPREWHVSTLGAELPLQRGFDITVAEQRPGEVPVVSSSGITSYHNKAMVAGPGVVTGRKGKLGDVYYVDRPFWPHDTTLWVTDFHGNSEKFAALLLSQMQLERFDAATSVPTLNRNFIHPLPIALPLRSEQERLMAVVEAWDECLDRESKWLDKLRDLKTGISTDLLTGRVRVPEGIAVVS